jgi:hypothetical protein
MCVYVSTCVFAFASVYIYIHLCVCSGYPSLAGINAQAPTAELEPQSEDYKQTGTPECLDACVFLYVWFYVRATLCLCLFYSSTCDFCRYIPTLNHKHTHTLINTYTYTHTHTHTRRRSRHGHELRGAVLVWEVAEAGTHGTRVYVRQVCVCVCVCVCEVYTYDICESCK